MRRGGGRIYGGYDKNTVDSRNSTLYFKKLVWSCLWIFNYIYTCTNAPLYKAVVCIFVLDAEGGERPVSHSIMHKIMVIHFRAVD